MNFEVDYSTRKIAYVKAVPSEAEGRFIASDLQSHVETKELVLTGVAPQDVSAVEEGNNDAMDKYVKIVDQDPTKIEFVGCVARVQGPRRLKGALFVGEVIEYMPHDRVNASK